MIELALVSSRVTVRASGVTIRRGVLGVGRSRTLAAADITEVEMPIQMQAGMTPYYSILVRRRAVPGRRLAGAVTLATGIRDKREAERLVAAITRALGRLPGAAREALTATS